MADEKDFWDRGYIQVYTGDGKGKTTAAFGLAMRAAAANLRVFVAQFVKGMRYSEIEAFERFSDLITVKQYGLGCFIRNKPTEEDVRAGKDGLEDARKALISGEYRVVILDEANIAVFFNLFSADDLLSLMDQKPEGVELVITGRRADPKILDRADLVTEMREVRHYYQRGVIARKGIES
ncbi:MAG: cob(I)yrinic acid a,c-diamide adenosyltransferase [Deltaproteobacteria bacterium]|nr:cob(I)yrinic acid a,c-diamide adenosyltransferase [Deltaproteobacteria bacterium]